MRLGSSQKGSRTGPLAYERIYLKLEGGGAEKVEPLVTYPARGRAGFLLSTLWPEGRGITLRRGRGENQCQIRFTRVMSAVIQHYSQQIHTGILVLARGRAGGGEVGGRWNECYRQTTARSKFKSTRSDIHIYIMARLFNYDSQRAGRMLDRPRQPQILDSRMTSK